MFRINRCSYTNIYNVDKDLSNEGEPADFSNADEKKTPS